MKPFSRIAMFLLMIAFFLTACGKVEMGIEGQVFLAKCTGTEIASGCVGQLPYPTTLDIYDQNLAEIESVKTAGDGTFVIALGPGTYFVHPANTGKFPMAADFKVVVTKGKLTELTVYYDNGTR